MGVGQARLLPHSQLPHSQILQKRLSFAACPAAGAGSNQHKAGRQARYRLAKLPHLPYIVNLGVTTELPTDHKALPIFTTCLSRDGVTWASVFHEGPEGHPLPFHQGRGREGKRENVRGDSGKSRLAALCLMLACL